MFRKFATVLALVATCFLMAGCYSVKMVAPPGNDITIMPEAKNASFKKAQRNWYAAWGLVPLNENAVKNTIRESGLTEVRLETKHTFLDYIISGFGSYISIVCKTTIIEGNAN